MAAELRRERWQWLAIALVGLTIYWIGNASTSLWDRDEPRYASTARTMLETGDWIVPYFNGDFRFQKPVLAYWLIMAAQAVFGDSEFAARFFSGIAVAGACVLLIPLGNRMFGRPVGVIAAWMAVLSPAFFLLGKLAIPDGPQLFFSTACYLCLYITLRKDGTILPLIKGELEGVIGQGTSTSLRPPAVPLLKGDGATAKPTVDVTQSAAFWFWISLAMAVLIKGPVIPGMIAGTLVVYWAATGVSPSQFALRWRLGATILFLITLPWFAAVYYATNGEFFVESVGHQLVGRAKSSFDGVWFPTGYYAVTSLLGFCPWIVFSLLAIIRQRSQWRTNGPVAFSFAWLIGSMVVLELFRSKQIHYYAPAYPAFALIAAGYFTPFLRSERPILEWSADWPSRFCLCLWIAATAVMTTSLVVVAVLGPSSSVFAALLMAGVLAGGGIKSIAALLRKDLLRSLLWQGATMGAAAVVLAGLLMPSMEDNRIAKSVARRLATETADGSSEIVQHRLYEPTLSHYSKRQVPSCFHENAFAIRVNYSSKDIVAAMTQADIDRVRKYIGDRLQIVHSWNGWVKMHPDVVHLVRITPAHPGSDRIAAKKERTTR